MRSAAFRQLPVLHHAPVTDDARRDEALELMLGRFPAVAERVERVYGLRLPRHVAVFAALWASTRRHPAEAAALSLLGVRPWGIAGQVSERLAPQAFTG
jgi:hypothetical protein